MNNKIVSINSSPSGSVGTIMSEIAELALKNNMEYFLFTGPGEVQLACKHYFICNRYQKLINMCFSYTTGYDCAILKHNTKVLISMIKEINPIIIHIHALHQWYIDYKLLFDYIEKNNIYVIWTMHDCWGFTGKCGHYASIQCSKWKSQCKKCPQLHEYPKSLFVDNSKFMYNLKKKYFLKPSNMIIVAVSKWLKEELSQSFFNKYPIQVIENGINTDIFREVKCEIIKKYGIEDKFIILGVANPWTYKKGYDDFLKLSQNLSEKLYKIVMIGLTKKQCKEVEKYNIMGLGKRNRDELIKWYSQCNVFFNPSIEETFGMVTAEAMACNSRVIVYNTTASPEIVNGSNSFIVRAHDITAVVKCIKNIKEGTGNKGKEGKRIIEEKYNMKDQYLKYIQLYRQIIKEKNHGGSIS